MFPVDVMNREIKTINLIHKNPHANIIKIYGLTTAAKNKQFTDATVRSFVSVGSREEVL